MLDTPLQELDGIGPKRAELLGNLGLETIRDLLYHFPRRYEDRRTFTAIADVEEGDTVTIEAEVVSARMVPLRRRMSLAQVELRDDTGTIKATWFGRGFLAKTFRPGMSGIFSGPAGKYKGLALKNPDYEMLTGEEEDRLHTGRVVPLYPLTAKVTQRMMRRWVRTALDLLDLSPGDLADAVPPDLARRRELLAVGEAMRAVHFPDEPEQGRQARDRFAYEELLALQVGVLRARSQRRDEESGIVHSRDGRLLRAFAERLPYTLTDGQARAVQDILDDMVRPRPMVRLLQGDVGCGKTLVALHAIAAAADGGFQTALMAPTEILAEQHYAGLLEHLEPLGLRVGILTGNRGNACATRAEIADGRVDVVVGTHALIQDQATFRNLGLAVIDEQHRFGVMQRSRLTEKGLNPDILHISATPIPRTLAITVYGGMDVSVIDQMPPGRVPVKTRRITPAKLDGLYGYIVAQARKGFQTYYVCPLVEESESRELADVTKHFNELSAGPFAQLRTGLLHGRLPSDEKDCVMKAFSRREIDVLFATTVIEVGVDVPTATVMVIEDAAQFGLTQLHQLRGRIGRGREQAYCFLLGKHETPDGKKRLEILCRTASGFELAEADLTMRGPGEFHGVRQAGMSDLRVADLVRDVRLLDRARRDAEMLLEDDPRLDGPATRLLAARSEHFRAMAP